MSVWLKMSLNKKILVLFLFASSSHFFYGMNYSTSTGQIGYSPQPPNYSNYSEAFTLEMFKQLQASKSSSGDSNNQSMLGVIFASHPYLGVFGVATVAILGNKLVQHVAAGAALGTAFPVWFKTATDYCLARPFKYCIGGPIERFCHNQGWTEQAQKEAKKQKVKKTLEKSKTRKIECTQLKKQIVRLEKNILYLQEQNKEVKNKLNEAYQNFNKRDKECTVLEVNNQNIESIIQNLNKLKNELVQKLEEKNHQYDQILQENNDLKTSKAVLVALDKQKEESLISLREQCAHLEKMKEEYDKVTPQFDGVQNNALKLETDLLAAKEALKNKEIECTRLLKESVEWKTKYEFINHENQQLKMKVNTLEDVFRKEIGDANFLGSTLSSLKKPRQGSDNEF